MAKAKTKGKAHTDAIALERLQVEYVAVDAIKPNVYNPNRQSEREFEMLLGSIQEDGFTQPVIITQDNVIVDGEHRWRAGQHLGYAEIPVVRVDMTEAQRRLSTLRHNTARGSHDIELEAGVLRDLERLGALEWAQDALSLSDIEVQRMLTDITPLDGIGGEEFGDSWDYERGSEADIDDANRHVSVSAAAKASIDNQRELQKQGLRAQDTELVKQTITMTRAQHDLIKRTLGENPADRMVALAESRASEKPSAEHDKDGWLTMQFVIPAAALDNINAELKRLAELAPTITTDLSPEFKRGLALEFMAELSSQTPAESLQ